MVHSYGLTFVIVLSGIYLAKSWQGDIEAYAANGEGEAKMEKDRDNMPVQFDDNLV
jgi:hypothetical protein